MLKDSSSYNRLFAARALGLLGDPATVPALREHLIDRDEVAREAQSAIAQINRRRVPEHAIGGHNQ